MNEVGLSVEETRRIGRFSSSSRPAGAQAMRRWLITTAAVAVALVPGLSATAQTVQAPATIATVAGNGVDGSDGDGGPAISAAIDHPRGIAVTPDGGFVFAAPFLPAVRRVGADGRITAVAGTGVAGFSGDGGSATSAQLNLVHGVALLPDGSLVLADTSNHRIRRVAPNGTITTVAGTGTFGFSGDGGPAVAAQIEAPRGIATLPDGSILFPDSGNHRVRRISPAGIITTVAGSGTPGFSGDDGPAHVGAAEPPVLGLSARERGLPDRRRGQLANPPRRARTARSRQSPPAGFSSPHAVAALPDGGFLVADTNNNRVVRVSSTGTMTTVAGIGTAGFSGDGGPAAPPRSTSRRRSPCFLICPASSSGDSANNRVRSSGSTCGRPGASHRRQTAPHDCRTSGDASLHAVRAGRDCAWRSCAAAPSSCA